MSGSSIGAADLSLFPLVRQLALPSMPQTQALVARFPTLQSWLRAVDEKTRSEHTVDVQ